MLTIREIAQYVRWKDVKRALHYYYPADKNDYKELFLSLPNRKEKKIGKKFLVIEGGINTSGEWFRDYGHEYLKDIKTGGEFQFHGLYILKKGDKSKVTYSCSFVPWDEMVNYPIYPETLRNHLLHEIMAHFLWEITFYGNEKQMEKKGKMLLKASEEIKSGKAKTVPMDKFIKKIGVKP